VLEVDADLLGHHLLDIGLPVKCIGKCFSDIYVAEKVRWDSFPIKLSAPYIWAIRIYFKCEEQGIYSYLR
ncbi:MAG: hypothetical protein QW105_01215, partial [Nitrososphaerota archaeon]